MAAQGLGNNGSEAIYSVRASVGLNESPTLPSSVSLIDLAVASD